MYSKSRELGYIIEVDQFDFEMFENILRSFEFKPLCLLLSFRRDLNVRD